MTIEVNSIAALNAKTRARGKSALDPADFLTLMTKQLQMQDPTAPSDTNSMLNQLTQISQVRGTSETNAALKSIADKLDVLIAAQVKTGA